MPTPIIDTQCHYNLEPLYSANGTDLIAWHKHWRAAQAKGVQAAIVVGTDLESSQRAIEIAAAEPDLWATVGIHPSVYSQQKPQTSQQVLAQQSDQLTEFLQNATTQKIIAIGETGLDYYRLDKKNPEFQVQREQQLAGFRLQIELANKYKLPLILHVRDNEIPEEKTTHNAFWDTLDQIESQYAWQAPAVLHCVDGPIGYVQAMVEAGAYLSFAGNVTYPSANRLRALASVADSNRVLIETDAPYLTPQSDRGQQCEPWMIEDTARFLAEHSDIFKTEPDFYMNTTSLFPKLSKS